MILNNNIMLFHHLNLR